MNTFSNYKIIFMVGLAILTHNAAWSNIAPKANAGPDQTIIYPLNYVNLSGSGSDDDGNIVSYKWTAISYSYSGFALPNPTGQNTDVLFMKVGTYVFELEVTDNQNLTGRDQVTIFVKLPPDNYNRIKETSLLVAGIKDVNSISSLTVTQKNESTTYFDGLGRPMQKVNWQASPDRLDVVQPVVYDLLGRESVKYLPYVSDEITGQYKPNPVGTGGNTYTNSPQYQFYQNTANVAHDQKPFTQTIYEASPLDRAVEQGAAGEAWQPGNVNNATTKVAYLVNIASEVPLWQYQVNQSGSEELVLKRYYEPGVLFKTVSTDEHQSQVVEYKDLEGKVILKKVQNGNQYLSTHYVYDDYNLLRVVVPPQANAELPNPLPVNYSYSSENLKKWCFTYQYDGKHRLMAKRVPGTGYTRMVYDGRDRLVLTQDAVQALKGEWIYTKYDVLGRPILSGKYTDARDLTTIQTAIDTQPNWYEEVAATGHGYTQGSCYPFNASDEDVLAVTYFDNYTHVGKTYFDGESADYSFAADDVVAAADKYDNMKGLKTGAKVKVLGKNKWINSVSYYDNKNRPIQTISKNYLGGLDKVSMQYDFVGKVLTAKLSHTGIEQATLTKTFLYDHAGRLVQAFHQIGTGTKVLLAENSYNKLGQLIDKGLGVKNNVPLQSVDYRYNIRGWLTSINNSSLTNDGSLNNDDNDVFGMEFLYEKPLGILGLGYNPIPEIGLPSLQTLGVPIMLASVYTRDHAVGSWSWPIQKN